MISRTKSLISFKGILAIVLVLGLIAGYWAFNYASASTSSTDDSMSYDMAPSTMAYFAKYEGVDGESQDANHEKWIEVLSIDWGVHQPGSGATGPARRRGDVEIDDFIITFNYEKAAPKLLEKCLKGEVIPKLEVELTTTLQGASQTYLKYELSNVSITSYDVSGQADSGMPPTVTVANNFEEIKVTYTEYDEEGNSKGNVETEYRVETERSKG